jgi:hypothetical protein
MPRRPGQKSGPPPAPTPKPRPMPLTDEKKGRFLDLLAKGHTVGWCAHKAGVHRRYLYEVREKDPVFAAAWAEAWEAGGEALEEEARRRAFSGVRKPVYYQGRVVGHIREFSDLLVIFLLKGRKPEVYRESLEVTGRGGGAIAIQHVEKAREDLAGRLDRLARRHRPTPVP